MVAGFSPYQRHIPEWCPSLIPKPVYKLVCVHYSPIRCPKNSTRMSAPGCDVALYPTSVHCHGSVPQQQDS